MRVTDILAKAKEPLFTFEILPPLKGRSVESVNNMIDQLIPFNPSYINITNHQMTTIYVEREDGLIERRTTRKRPGTIGLSAAIQYKYQIPVVPHLICGGLSDHQIEDQLVELNFLQIKNVLAIRGDPPHGERRFKAAVDGYEHTDALVGQIADANRGKYLDPTLREPIATNFCIGVAGYPEKHSEAPNLEYDIKMLKKKVDMGAEYIVTQMFFINEHYHSFVKKCRMEGIDVPIIPGIKPIQKKSDLDLLPHTFHVDLPNDLVGEVTEAKSNEQVREIGIEYTIKQVNDLLSSSVPSIHFYTQGRANTFVKIVEQTFGK
jgi:methylenetetrahydrofolate reductase (NADPH)